MLEYVDTINDFDDVSKLYELIFLDIVIQGNIDGAGIPSPQAAALFKLHCHKKTGLESLLEDINQMQDDALYLLIRSHIYPVLNKSGLLKQTYIDGVYEYHLAFWQDIDLDDTNNVLRVIQKKMTKFANTKNRSQGKSYIPLAISPFEALRKRVIREYKLKKLLGDIQINDEEFELLRQYASNCFTVMKKKKSHLMIDKLFAVALVHMGIRLYSANGSFWPHVAEAFGLRTIPGNQQAWINQSFYITLNNSGKLLLQNSNDYYNIIMHGYVPNHYSDYFFEFLFKFYELDLERNVAVLDKVEMSALVDCIIQNDNTNRTYLLTKGTAEAVRLNPSGSKTKLRMYLKLIDRFFWDDSFEVSSSNRLINGLYQWAKTSKNFQLKRREYTGNGRQKGEPLFSSPYLKCDFKKQQFLLALPSQRVCLDNVRSLEWQVSITDKIYIYVVPRLETATGYKTEGFSVPISSLEILDRIDVRLTDNNEFSRKFPSLTNINGINFFDRNGVCIGNRLREGEIFGFTAKNDLIISNAIVDQQPFGELQMYYFDFQLGDLVCLPNRQFLAVGKGIEEGVCQRGQVTDATCLWHDQTIPLYSTFPDFIIKILPSSSKGTAITINGRKEKLFDRQTNVFDLNDGSGEAGYYIKLDAFELCDNGIYDIVVDVPNDRTKRNWVFAYIKNFKFDFEDSPYIFKQRGTVIFNDAISIHTVNEADPVNNTPNAFQFEISPSVHQLTIPYKIENDKMQICVSIPALYWRVESGDWQIGEPEDIWHGEFPTWLYIKYPSQKILLKCANINYDKLSTVGEEDDGNEIYTKQKNVDCFKCDLTRFKSWIGNEYDWQTIKFESVNTSVDFFRVITKSQVVSGFVKGDFNNGLLIGEFKIIGKSSYCADILMNDTVIAEQVLLTDGRFEMYTELASGIYTVSIYEYDDDTGFGSPQFLKNFFCKLVDPYNLENKTLIPKFVRKDENIPFNLIIAFDKYIISNLQKSDADNPHIYDARLEILDFYKRSVKSIRIQLNFTDLNFISRCEMTFWEDGEFICFLFDSELKYIVQEESARISKRAAYRRYISLQDALFEVELLDLEAPIEADFKSVSKVSNAESEDNHREKTNVESSVLSLLESQNQAPLQEKPTGCPEMQQEDTDNIAIIEHGPLDMLLSESGLEPLIYNALKNAGYICLRDLKALIDRRGVKSLAGIKNIDKRKQSRIIDILRKHMII